MNFIANSLISKKIHKLALMLQEMDINVYIYGEKGVGKTFLATFISPQAKLYNEKLNDKNSEVIIENINNEKNLNLNFKRIIATGEQKLYGDLKKKFTMEIELKPLNKRKNDIKDFIKLFQNQAQKELKINNKITKFNIDISENLHSLKREIYKTYLCNDYTKNDVIHILKTYFEKNYGENDSYNSCLQIFDKALIETLLEKYKSKLQVANHLKINRHTLTKKVEQLEN